MRIRALLAVAVTAAALAIPQTATAADAPPDPATCTPKIEAVATPADPGGVVATGVVAVASAQIVCTRNLIDDTIGEIPTEATATWWGHVTIYFQWPTGGQPERCGHGPDVIPAVGPVLVLAAVQTCQILPSDIRRLNTLEVVVVWATLDATHYLCCQTRVVRAAPVGVL